MPKARPPQSRRPSAARPPNTSNVWLSAVLPLAVAAAAVAITVSLTRPPGNPLVSADAASAWLGTVFAPTRPLDTIKELEPMLDGRGGHDLGPGVRCRLLDVLADALALCHRYPEAHTARRAALSAAVEADQPIDALVLTAAVAQDLQRLERHDEALTQLEAAHAALQASPLKNPEVTAVILKLEARVYDCAGDPVTALLKYEDALAAAPPGQVSVGDVASHVDLLLKVLRGTSPEPPPEVAEHIQTKIHQLVDAGPWTSPLQVPSHFVPFPAPPVFDVKDEASLPPGVAAAVRYLKSAAQDVDMAAEVQALTDGFKLQRDAECLHVPSRGRWYRFPLNAPWQDRDASGCSVDTPVACQVVAGLRELGVVSVLRAGYSVIDPDTHIQPHFGTTNTQLKLHLGIHIPAGPEGQPCTAIRVANTTLAWTQGGVLVFDDSYEHEVVSGCDERRAVLQVVIAHPLAPKPTTEGADGRHGLSPEEKETQLWGGH